MNGRISSLTEAIPKADTPSSVDPLPFLDNEKSLGKSFNIQL